MNKTTDTILTIINNIVQIACYLFLGFMFGMLLGVYSDNPDRYLVIALLTIGLYLVWTLVHIVLHEAGHMVAGLLTGYSFVSFRVGKYTLIKTTYGLQLRKNTVLGTAGQCIMCPPSIDPEKSPYKLYYFGGSFANLLTAALMLGGFCMLPLNMTSFFSLFMPGMMGLAMGLSNLLPAKMGGMTNDGYNLFIELKDSMVRKCMNIVLTMTAGLTLANDFSDINGALRDELMGLDFDELDIANSCVCNAYTYRAAILFSERKYDEAYDIYKRILDTDGVIKVFKNEAKCECLFYKILKNAPAEEIDALYDKDCQIYIRATSLYPSRHRLMYAYHLLYKKDSDKAMDEFAAIMRLMDEYAIKADVQLEFDIINEIRIANQ